MWGNQVEMDQNLSDNLKTLSVNPHIRKEGLKKWNGLHDVYSHKGFFLFSVVPISAVCDATWVPAWLVEDTLNGGAVTRRSVRSSSWEWKFTAVNIVMRNVVPDMWWMDSVMFSCVCMVPVKPVRGLQCGEGSAFVLLLSTGNISLFWSNYVWCGARWAFLISQLSVRGSGQYALLAERTWGSIFMQGHRSGFATEPQSLGWAHQDLFLLKDRIYTSLSLLWLLPMVGYGVLVCSVRGAAQGNAGWGTQRDTWGLNNLGEILLGIKTQDMYFYYYYYYYYSHFVFWTKCFLFCEALLQLGEVIIFHEVASNSAVLTLRLTKHAQLWFFWRRIYSNICW